MDTTKWVIGEISYETRMPPLGPARMTPAQSAAAAALIAGPRKGVKGPFVPLLRSPELMNRLQKVGEYLRFDSALPPRISEFVMLIVAREWTQHFEWHTHVPLARNAGVADETIGALAEGRRPDAMAGDEAAAYDFCDELFRTKGVSDATYRRAVLAFGEQGVIDLIGLAGYFTSVSMVMNAAHSPPENASGTTLSPFPL